MILTVITSVLATLWVILCLGLFTYRYLIESNWDLQLSGSTPCTSHATLKQLIERLLKESTTLPYLQRRDDHPASPQDETNRTYEDLLATAIINKVISGSQNNLPTSSNNSISSRISSSSKQRVDNKEYFFGEETLDRKWKNTDLDTTSVSSSEDFIIPSDSSVAGSTKYVDKLTLTIKQDIEDFDSSDESENEPDTSEAYLSPVSYIHDDDTNWYLRKRQFGGTNSPVPVPMLVPKPTVEAKVFIGDKEADETSDLSDGATELEENDSLINNHKLLITSKSIIGGQNNIQLLTNGNHEDSSASSDSGVKDFDESDDKLYHGTTKSDSPIIEDEQEPMSYSSINSNSEKVAEYTEKYGTLPKTIVKTPEPMKRQFVTHSRKSSSQSENLEEPVPQIQNMNACNYVGQYSKREKEKWSHAVEMKNNPYTAANIEKRVKRSSSAAGSLFGSDYYARLASSPSGGKVKSSELNNWPPSPNREDIEETKQSSEIADNDIHQAIQVVIKSEEESITTTHDSEHNYSDINTDDTDNHENYVQFHPEFTSDSDLSYTNYYDVEKSEIHRKKQSENIVETYKMLPNNDNDDVFVEKDVPVPVAKPRKTGHNNINGDNKEKPIFVKAPSSIAKSRTFTQQRSHVAIRKHRSESDIIMASTYDAPVTVLPKKKDNSLISKIYSNPSVRNFALGQRQHLPIIPHEKPSLPFRTQLSVDAKFLSDMNFNKTSYTSSDDGHGSEYSSKTGKMSFFSSEEDLLSLASNKEARSFVLNNEYKGNNTTLRYKKNSVSSEDGILSDFDRPYKLTKAVFNSTENLLSIDEPKSTLAKRKDNTLISKIYLDPNVRNFALNSRDYVEPVVTPRHPVNQIEDTVDAVNHLIVNSNQEEKEVNSTFKISKEDYVSGASSTEISLDYVPESNSHDDNNNNTNENNVDGNPSETADPNVDEIAKKRLVHNLLGRFTKSYSTNSIFSRTSSIEDNLPHISVKTLKKKFEVTDTKTKVVSSLTARSLSKQMKESLRE